MRNTPAHELESRVMIQRWQECQCPREKARLGDMLFRRFEGVIGYARKRLDSQYQHRDWEDVAQELGLMLMRSLERYDASKGYTTLTYLQTNILRRTMSALDRTSKSAGARIPAHAMELGKRISREESRLRSMGVEPNDKLLAERCKTTTHAIHETRQNLAAWAAVVEIDCEHPDGEGYATHAQIGDPHAQDPAKYVTSDLFHLKEQLRSLPERERRILLLSHAGFGLDEIAHAMGETVSRERVRQILMQATERLRKACNASDAADALPIAA